MAWVGDLTEIPTDEGKLQLAAIIDLHSRRVPGFAMDIHHDAALARRGTVHGHRGTRRVGGRGDLSTPTKVVSTPVSCSPRHVGTGRRRSRWAAQDQL